LPSRAREGAKRDHPSQALAPGGNDGGELLAPRAPLEGDQLSLSGHGAVPDNILDDRDLERIYRLRTL